MAIPEKAQSALPESPAKPNGYLLNRRELGAAIAALLAAGCSDSSDSTERDSEVIVEEVCREMGLSEALVRELIRNPNKLTEKELVTQYETIPKKLGGILERMFTDNVVSHHPIYYTANAAIGNISIIISNLCAQLSAQHRDHVRQQGTAEPLRDQPWLNMPDIIKTQWLVENAKQKMSEADQTKSPTFYSAKTKTMDLFAEAEKSCIDVLAATEHIIQGQEESPKNADLCTGFVEIHKQACEVLSVVYAKKAAALKYSSHGRHAEAMRGSKRQGIENGLSGPTCLWRANIQTYKAEAEVAKGNAKLANGFAHSAMARCHDVADEDSGAIAAAVTEILQARLFKLTGDVKMA